MSFAADTKVNFANKFARTTAAPKQNVTAFCCLQSSFHSSIAFSTEHRKLLCAWQI